MSHGTKNVCVILQREHNIDICHWFSLRHIRVANAAAGFPCVEFFAGSHRQRGLWHLLVIHATCIAAGVGRAFSRICLFVRVLKGNGLSYRHQTLYMCIL